MSQHVAGPKERALIDLIVQGPMPQHEANNLKDIYHKARAEIIATATEQWILVSERLPEIGEPILFITITGSYHKGSYGGTDSTPYRWWDGVGWHADRHVTHWQPLPPAPVQEESK